MLSSGIILFVKLKPKTLFTNPLFAFTKTNKFALILVV